MRRTTKIWILLFSLLLIFALVFAFWDTLVMLIAPKAVLSAAIQQAISDLEGRWNESPFAVIAAGYDREGKNNVDLDLSVSGDLFGTRTYRLQVLTDIPHNLIQASGTVEGESLSLEDITLYADSAFIALSSEELLGDAYYGITYSTFSQDLNQIPLLSFLVPNETREKWAERIGSIQDFMNQDRKYPVIPEISRKELQYLTLGIMALKCDISKENCIVDGTDVSCRKFVYQASGSQVAPLAEALLGTSNLETGSIQATFFLYGKNLVRTELWAASGEDSISYILELSENLSSGRLSLGMSKIENGISETFSAALVPQGEGESRAEAVSINDFCFSYIWEPESGKLQLSIPDRDEITLYLHHGDDGVLIETQDLPAILNVPKGEKTYECSMMIGKGAEISAPAYKNLDDWSLQDLLILLNGVGSVLGLFD